MFWHNSHSMPVSQMGTDTGYVEMSAEQSPSKAPDTVSGAHTPRSERVGPPSDSNQLDYKIHTVCLVICALAVIAAAAYYLKSVLIPFVLARALAYLLLPVIDLLSCSRQHNCKFRLPRALATVIAFAIALGTLFIIGIIIGTLLGF